MNNELAVCQMLAYYLEISVSRSFMTSAVLQPKQLHALIRYFRFSNKEGTKAGVEIRTIYK